MDSGNSGSIQSSSGGDEEYDDSSRATDFISPFPSTHHLSTTPPPHHRHHHNSTTLFDSLPNYFDPTPLPNFGDPTATWSKTTLPNCTYNSLFPSSTSSASSPTVIPFDPPKTDPVQPPQQQLARNPKKRSRASRRAPTTVLTTDTTNFRAMVQEFTGIPAPPFTSSSSPFLRNRLDLFGAPASTRSYSLSDGGLLQPPPYLLRPFAQKFQTPPPFLGPNNSNDVVPGNSTGSNSNSNSNAAASVNYQMQNQILTFQSLLQSPSVLRSSGQDLLEMPPSGNINDDDVNNPTVWGGGGVLGLDGGDHRHHQGNSNNHAIMRAVNGSSYVVDYSQSGGGKQQGNYEKGSENVVAGRGPGGGMVESWICSSDH